MPVLENAIGVFGGIFDPVHNGHLALASLARDFFSIPQILFVPSGKPPHKSNVGASAADRLAMLELAIRHEPSFCIRDEELQCDAISYTVDTIRSIRSDFPGRTIFFIVGSDNLREIETWRRYRELLKMVTLCVAHRPGHSIIPPRSLASSGTIIPFPSPEWGISSSMVRAYIACGYSCDHLVPASVANYISDKKLYRFAAGES